jgi:hypothetical protein
MSEYYLADRNAEERERRRRNVHQATRDPKESQNMKVTLLGDFLFPTSEPRGCDPYNATHGKSTFEAWRMRRDRR